MIKKVNFSERLTSLRKEKELSQYELADLLGYSRGQIGNYEQGTREPDHSTLEKIADFFNVSIDYLLGKSNVRESADKILEKSNDTEYTVALHNNNGYDEELPEEARKEIDNFIEFVKQKYGKKE